MLLKLGFIERVNVPGNSKEPQIKDYGILILSVP